MPERLEGLATTTQAITTDDRAVTPVVEKAVTLGIVVVFLGVAVSALYGGAVPEYRQATGAELGDRVLSRATVGVERAVPPPAAGASSSYRMSLPPTIRGSSYRLRGDGQSVVLDHPSDAVGGRAYPVFPARVVRVEGTVPAGRIVVRARQTSAGVVLSLEEGSS